MFLRTFLPLKLQYYSLDDYRLKHYLSVQTIWIIPELFHFHAARHIQGFKRGSHTHLTGWVTVCRTAWLVPSKGKWEGEEVKNWVWVMRWPTGILRKWSGWEAVTNRWRWQVKFEFKNVFAGRQVITGQMTVRIPDLSPKGEFSWNVRHINPPKRSFEGQYVLKHVSF